MIRPVAPVDIQIGDILAVCLERRRLAVHRVIAILPERRFITKGDSLVVPDPRPVSGRDVTGKVTAILRGRRLIPVASGYRERVKRLSAWLSMHNFTRGGVKSKVKQAFFRNSTGRENIFPRDDRLLNRNRLCDLVRRKRPGDRMDLKSLEMSAVQEGMAGYLYPLIRPLGFSEQAAAVFRKHYLTIAARNLIGQAAIARLDGDLHKAQISIMVLKGASLPETVYPRPGLRMMEDIDIMVRPADRQKFIELLGRHGFRTDPGREHCFIRGLTIADLHTDALNSDRVASRRWLFPAGMGPVWDRAVPWRDGLRRIKRPAEADNLLLLAQHALKHACGRLIWLVDMWLLLRGRPPKFWRDLYSRAEQLGQMKALYQVLFLLEREFSLAVPHPFKSPAGEVPWLARQLLIKRVDGKKDAYAGILLPLLTISGLPKRLAFARESVFLSRATARKEFGGAFDSRPIRYYLSRLGLTASQAVSFVRRLKASAVPRRRI